MSKNREIGEEEIKMLERELGLNSLEVGCLLRLYREGGEYRTDDFIDLGEKLCGERDKSYGWRLMESYERMLELFVEGGEEEGEGEGFKTLTRLEVETYLSEMIRGRGVNSNGRLQALSLYIRMKGWLGEKEGDDKGLGEELSRLLKN